jgi:hypothetical protein
MPRSSAQSDFVVLADPDPVPDPELPAAAGPVRLPPRAWLRSNEASAIATRIVMIATGLVLAALLVLTLVGPHIPAGE